MNRNSRLVRFVNAYIRWPLYLLLLTFAMDICLYAAQPKVLYIGLIYTGAYIVILICLYFRKNRRLNKQLAEFGFRFNQVQRKMLLDLKVPYAMLDRDGCVLWANDEFRNITGMYLNHYYDIGQFFPNITKQELRDCVEEILQRW